MQSLKQMCLAGQLSSEWQPRDPAFFWPVTLPSSTCGLSLRVLQTGNRARGRHSLPWLEVTQMTSALIPLAQTSFMALLSHKNSHNGKRVWAFGSQWATSATGRGRKDGRQKWREELTQCLSFRTCVKGSDSLPVGPLKPDVESSWTLSQTEHSKNF